MFLPNVALKGLNKIYTNKYGGLDERDYVDGAGFSDMRNMSSDNFPYISPRRKRKSITKVSDVSAMCFPEYNSENEIADFTGVADGYFYYKGTKIENIKLSDSQKEIVDFNGKLCIFPDKVYYRYLPDPDSDAVDNKLTDMEKELKLSGLRFYSIKNEDKGTYSAYIEKSDAGFDEVFKTGDSIVISNARNEQNNVFVADSFGTSVPDGRIVSAVADTVTADKITFILSDKNGSRATFSNTTDNGEVSVRLAIPDMNHICVHNNRLWGTSPDGRYVYASKLGDCCNFYSYRGLANDSWYGEVGTGGEFTGIVSYRTGIVAFKKNYIHQIYGDKPSSFAIPKQISGGCIDGRSIAEIDGTLFFLGNDGFYIYSGGQPHKISHQLKKSYIGAVAKACRHKYYVCVTDAEGECSVMVYDTQNSLWHREDNSEIKAMATHNAYLYAVVDNDMYCLNAEDGAEEFEWSIVTGRFASSMFNQKGIEGLNIRINAIEEVAAKIYISYNEGEFTEVGELCGSGIVCRRIPVRYRNCDCYRVKIFGTGYAVIEAIERVFFASGREFGNTKEGLNGE